MILVDLLESIKLSSLTYVIIIKLISPIINLVDEINNNYYYLVFIIMLPLFSCLSCFDIPLLPFIQSFETGFTVTMYTCTYSLDNSEVKGRPSMFKSP